MLRKIIHSVVVLGLLFSCSKEKENNHEGVNGLIDAKVYKAYKKASNPQNPWEHYGLIHNDILDELKAKKIKDFKKNPDLFGKSVKSDENLDYALNRLNEKYGREGVDLGGESTKDEIKHILNDSDNFYANILEEYTGNNVNVNIAVKDLFRLIEDFSKQDEVQYESIKDEIVKFESKILDNTYSLNSEDKDFVLKMTSVARYSFYFWSNQSQPSSKTGKRPWWKWVVVGAADVAGGVTGNVAGALGASVSASVLVDWVAPEKEEKETTEAPK
ncbi:hypothetical protein ACF3OB_06490 [Capnocytophaga canis]|uniref:hypothetical protein n=1 Tax=Capnocytophaga canis TaxID=1848903 RepID=UPI00370D1EB9